MTKRLFTFDKEAIASRTEKTCNTCGKTKPLASFHKHKGSLDGYRNDCKLCRKIFKDKSIIKTLPDFIICGVCGQKLPRTKEYFSGNLNLPKSNRKCNYCKNQYHKNINLEKSYTINMVDYKNMITKQNGKCIICGSTYKLVVDHDHHTNKIRAILCDCCNRGLGFFREDVEIMQKAIDYLNYYSK